VTNYVSYTCPVTGEAMRSHPRSPAGRAAVVGDVEALRRFGRQRAVDVRYLELRIGGREVLQHALASAIAGLGRRYRRDV
jgi:hypothetical protein